MARITLSLMVALSVVCVACASTIPSFLIPVEHRGISDARSLTVVPGAAKEYGYRLVPTDEYAVTEFYDTEKSLWDYVPNPITALKTVGSTSLSIIKYAFSKVFMVAIGAGLVLGFCALTPYCTLSFDKYPSFNNGYRALFESNPMDQLQGFVNKAIEKYRSLQNV